MSEDDEDMDGGRRVDGEPAVRRLLRSWMSRPAPEDDEADNAWPGGLGAGLDVPPAAAGEVIAAARRVAGDGRADAAWPAPELRLIAETMVLDEHPSASEWTDAERGEALHWVTLIIHRHGENGVQRLIAELNAR
ncbi:hypothetical protein [Actinoallomurus iriomotensis]|uniref:Uncharacterized protein n=1 Tax=Actinoallomurus iriomotensis TaxID=478107 RepID=A0A9W6RDH6_9ACTN|nr:hypothetical protein [Actinoallomurus iriomotensis]GLY73783.1 hypothetical protein Airi01_020500 [Actinoallomurus iriomotensis]